MKSKGLTKTIRSLALAAMAGTTLLGSSITAMSQETPLTFWLNYPAAGFNAGFELAAKNGYYKDAGLSVKIEPGNGSQITAQLIASGKAEIGFADSAPVMKLVSEGAKIKILATILQGNPNQVTALKDKGIASVKDLKGKSVAIPNGGSQAAMFPLVLAANGLTANDIKQVNMPRESMVAALLQGQVDAILGSIDFFAIQLKDLGAETVDFPFIDNGAPTVSTSIIASESYLEKNAGQAKAFVAASLKGWYAAVDDPKAAVAAMKELFPDASEDQAPAQLEATKYLMCVNRAKFVGKATPEQWTDTVSILSKIGMLPAEKEATSYYTYDFLPPEADLRPCPLN